ncbi:MAG TPA: hypothetical protein VLI07_04060 [Candidatus Binatus sp.]|nr:hypothetical protein [Candidatus Binatus sp.]
MRSPGREEGPLCGKGVIIVNGKIPFPALPRGFGGRRTALCRAVMTDVVVRYSLTYLLLGKGCYVVEGDVS